jgi:hypothetical protein
LRGRGLMLSNASLSFSVAAEILHRGKSVSAVLSMIAEKAGVPDRRRS